MSDNVQRPPGGREPVSRGASKRGGCGAAIAIVFVLYLVVFWATGGLGLTGDDTDFYSDESDRYSENQVYLGNPIPRFTPQDARALSQALSEAEREYGVCFGWKLTDGGEDAEPYRESVTESATDPPASYDQGSSRGPDTPASTCPRWVEVQVTVAYTSESGESWSGVGLRVEGSQNFSSSDLPGEEDFAELGMTAEQFIDAPVQTTGHAALALPLLLVQNGALEAPASDRAAGEPARPLPPAEGGGTSAWVWFGILTALTLVAAGLGITGTARRRKSSEPPPGPPGAAAAPAGSAPQQPHVWHPHQGQSPQAHPNPPLGSPTPPPQTPPGPTRGAPPPWPQGPPPQGPPPQGPPQR